MRDKIEALHKYQRFSLIAVCCAVLLVVTFGIHAIVTTAFPQSAAAEFFRAHQASLLAAQLVGAIALASWLALLKLPRGFFRDPQVASSLNDERTKESTTLAYRNAFYAVLLCQGIAPFLLANSASAHAVWMLALTTLLVGIATYAVSYAVYEWI